MDTIKINLEKFRGLNSTLFTGRPQGEAVRKELKLNDLDKGTNKIIFVIPKGTSSFNPSFYLGMLFDSIKFLGEDKFDNTYSFEIVDENDEIKKVLKDNLNDGKRNAMNTILKKTGFKRFID